MSPYSLPFIAPTQIGPSDGLLRLRWFAVFGQLATIGVAIFIANIDIRWAPQLGLIAVTAISNAE